MLVPYLEGFGRPLLPLATKSLDSTTHSSIACRAMRDGSNIGARSLQVVTADQPLEEVRRIASDARAAGLECELLDERAVRDAEPQLTPEVSAALFMKSHGFVVTADLSGALVAAAIKHGARVRVPARAQRIEHRDDTSASTSTECASHAHHVGCAGSWSGLSLSRGSRHYATADRGQLQIEETAPRQ